MKTYEDGFKEGFTAGFAEGRKHAPQASPGQVVGPYYTPPMTAIGVPNLTPYTTCGGQSTKAIGGMVRN